MKRILSVFQSSAFRTSILGLAVVAAIYAVIKNWPDVSKSISALPWWLVAIEVVLAFIYVYMTMRSWRVILNDVGPAINHVVARRIFFSSQVAKYLPGGVWNFVAAAEVGKDYEISRRRSVCVLLVSMMISIVTGMLLAVLAVVLGPQATAERYWWVAALIPVGIAVLSPPVLNRIVNVGLRLLRRSALEDDMTWGGTARASAWALLGWIAIGLQLWLVLTALGMDASLSSFLLSTGGYALGWTAGFLVFFVPAGAGVREVALGAVLSTVVSSGVVVTVVLLTRVFTTVADIGFGIAASIRMKSDQTKGNKTSQAPNSILSDENSNLDSQGD